MSNEITPERSSSTVDVNSPEAAASALRVFFRISKAWGLAAAEERNLLGVGKTTLSAWRAGRVGAGLRPVTLERLSYIFGIYAGIATMLAIPERAHAWIRKRNSAPMFGGESALRRMLGGQVGDLVVVHTYVTSKCIGDFS